MKDPRNEVERAYAVAERGPEGRPEFFRQLRESMLAFLMPYHPEMGGVVEFKRGDTMSFSVWENAKGSFIPIFTSMARAEQALKNIGAPDDESCVAETKGEWLFQALVRHKHPVVINPACGMREFYLDRNAVKLLADGSILKPLATATSEHGRLRIVEPADYPTDFIQPLFRFLRGRPEVRAAWLFRQLQATEPGKIGYVFGLLVTGEAEELKQDFAVVAHAACPPDAQFGVTFLDPKNPAIAKVMAKFPAFYAAPGFRAPGLGQEDVV